MTKTRDLFGWPGLATLAAGLIGATGSLAQADCGPAGDVQFLCGVNNMEQLISIDGTKWAVGSSAAGGAAQLAPIYFVDTETATATALDPSTVTLAEDKAAYPGCPGPADFSNLQSLGVDFEVVNGRNLLTVIAHGGGFSIQVFEMNTDGALPQLSWLGCVMPPDEHFWPDALATLPDGGMLVTSLFDPTDGELVAHLNSGAPYGSLGEWHPGSGWTEAYPGTFAGPNGVILSSDYKTLFIANWSGRRITRIDRESGKADSVEMGMLVDNLAWNADHTKILVGGQTDSIDKAFAECVPTPNVNCAINFAVYEVDPVTLEKRALFGPGMIGVMGGGTGALEVGDQLWITSYRSDRMARMAYPK